MRVPYAVLLVVPLGACANNSDVLTESRAASAGLSATITARAAAIATFLGDRDPHAIHARCPHAAVAAGDDGLVDAIDFGDDGCDLPMGLSLSGGLTVDHDTVTLHQLVASGLPLEGTIDLGAELTFSLTYGKAYVTFDGVAVPDGEGYTFDGQGVFMDDSPLAAYQVTGVHHELGSCYAERGSLATDDATVDFSGRTPTTGDVVVNNAGASTVWPLPAYAACPPVQ